MKSLAADTRRHAPTHAIISAHVIPVEVTASAANLVALPVQSTVRRTAGWWMALQTSKSKAVDSRKLAPTRVKMTAHVDRVLTSASAASHAGRREQRRVRKTAGRLMKQHTRKSQAVDTRKIASTNARIFANAKTAVETMARAANRVGRTERRRVTRTAGRLTK